MEFTPISKTCRGTVRHTLHHNVLAKIGEAISAQLGEKLATFSLDARDPLARACISIMNNVNTHLGVAVQENAPIESPRRRIGGW